MKDRIAKHDALSQDPDLRERVAAKYIKDNNIEDTSGEIKELIMIAINEFATEDQSVARDDAFYCREPTIIKLLKKNLNDDEMNVDKLLKNTFNSL